MSKWALLASTVGFAVLGCKASDANSPLVDLANRLYLDGSWTWSDSMTYSGYVSSGGSEPHYGSYIFTGTATLEAIDSADTEQYVLTATAGLEHVDSAGGAQITAWVVSDIQYDDTVEVRNDTIFSLSVEPIPPQAGSNTNLVRWVLDNRQLWCTNWLRDSLPAGNRDSCQTVIRWDRADPRVP
jgi:hypothetical protein